MRSYFNLGQIMNFPEPAAEFGLDYIQTSTTVPSTFLSQIEVPCMLLRLGWKMENRAIKKFRSLLCIRWKLNTDQYSYRFFCT